jgi:acetyl esterase/lipase
MIMKYIFLLIAVFTFRFSVAFSQEQRRIIVDSLVKQTAVKKDIRYNQSGRPLLLDIYYPSDFKGKALPCIVWIHGGGLTNTSIKKDYDIIRWGTALSAINGFIAVSVDYRLLGEAPLPAAIEDCATAIRFLKANARQYGIDTIRIGVAGESAGGYLAGFCAFAGNSDTFKTKDWQNHSNRINCAVLWYPATNHKGYYMLDYISEDDVPVLLIHGDNDRLVHICHSYLIEKSCKDNNVPVEMVVIENADHGFFINLTDPFAKFDLYRKNMERAVYLTIDYFKSKLSF